MAFEIKRLSKEQQGVAQFVCTQRLFITADRSRLVEEEDPAAAHLYCTVGMQIPMKEAVRLGLVADLPTPEPEVKERQPEETKESAPQFTKKKNKGHANQQAKPD